MSYTILSAEWANEDGTAVIIHTKESGAVAISEIDRPELWAKLLASGIEITGERSNFAAGPATVLQASGPNFSGLTFLAHALLGPWDGPKLRATPFRAGPMRGTVYDFATIGTELPMHSHAGDAVHISVVAQGRVRSTVDGQPQVLQQGDVVAFRAGQQHNLVALEPLSRVINAVYGR